MASHSPPDSYLTLVGEGRSEIKIQRSRFIGVALPAASEDSARAALDQVARQYHDSRHVCHAWRLGHAPDTVENRNDDGEPSGTAGEPILAAIRKRDLVDTVVLVVRYFGGIKLGTGGLQRAYGQAAEAALAATTSKEVLLGREFLVRFPYSFQKTMSHLLEPRRGRVLAEEYGADVQWRIWLPHSTWEAMAAALTEASAGQITMEPAG
jgi:uncharacterized YigZ family protein